MICRECGIPLVNHPTEDCDGLSETPDIYVEAWESTTRVLGDSRVERITCSWDWLWGPRKS